MCSNTWAKWLSGIALVIVGSSVLMGIWGFFSGQIVRVDSTEITALLLAIVAVIISFSKDKDKKRR